MKLNNYNKPTPAKWAKLGMAILSVSTFIAGYGVTADNDIVAFIGLGCGIIGTFLTNLFTEK
jgi:hypothetical protein